MQVGKSAFYAWKARPPTLVTAVDLHLYRRAKALFHASRDSLGSRELAKKLREEGFAISRERTRKLMRKLNLVVKQRVAYKVTTKRKHGDQVADNLLNQNFNPVAANEVWAGDITYLKTAEGWMYLAIVMDLFSRRIVGWHIGKRMTTDLICKAMIKAVNVGEGLYKREFIGIFTFAGAPLINDQLHQISSTRFIKTGNFHINCQVKIHIVHIR